MSCCPHPAEDHETLSACQEVTHYPSEDYPCLCHGHVGDEVCRECSHPRGSHVVMRVCRVEGCSCSAAVA